jgi:cytochrome c biogenesis protein CcmG, thiol:disulfide interchange protein DsbE
MSQEGSFEHEGRREAIALARELSTQIRRRDFIKLVAVVGLGYMIPGMLPGGAEAAMRAGDIPPKVILGDLKGNSVALPADFKGKVALIHFWASWCTSCRPEMIALESIYGKYKKSVVIPCSVNVGESRETAESYIRNLAISYPVLLDLKSSVAKEYRVSGIPTTYVLDRENVIKYRILGEINRDGLEKIVKTLL